MWFPSIFSVLKAGIGPSSSHTLGPIRAARDFRGLLAASGLQSGRIEAVLMGSLALTGKGHLSDLAVTAGLAGFDPQASERDTLQARYRAVAQAGEVRIDGRAFAFEPERDIVFDTRSQDLPHPNTLRLALCDPESGAARLAETYRSVGGGEVLGGALGRPAPPPSEAHPRMSLAVDHCLGAGQDLVRLALDNEARHHGGPPEAVQARLATLWDGMTASIDRGLQGQGLLPGRLQLPRRAGEMFATLQRNVRQWRVLSRETTLAATYAIAVAEENAAGGRIVTAPTCGSAGIVPAALKLIQERFHLGDARIIDGLVVAGFVGALVAHNASIAGAEVGCQGEVGVASAMAAAAVCQVLDGTVPQVEAAAEMALEHHLGLTCDPVAGLVQVPCIERNAVGAVTALNAANLALLSSGKHLVSFDAAVATLRQVGADMPRQYKETALGGLAAEARP